MPDKDVLKSIADNPILFKAVKDIIVSEFNLDTVSTTMSDEKMGQVIRARVSGLEKVERAFKKIEQFRTIPQGLEQKNPAR